MNLTKSNALFFVIVQFATLNVVGLGEEASTNKNSDWHEAWESSEQRIAGLEYQIQEIMNRGSLDQNCQCATEECCASQATWFAGYSFLFAKPHMKESFQATITNQANGTLDLVPLENDYELTPRVWLGYTGKSGIGMRAQYWRYDHAANPLTRVSDGANLPGATVTTVIFPAAIIAPAPGDVLYVTNSLDVQTLFLEGTLDLAWGCTELLVGGGLAYARLEQGFRATANRGTAVVGDLAWTRRFEGIGPTVGASVRHPLANCLSAIGNFRGSLLYGEKTLARTVVGDITPNPAPPNVLLNDADEVSGVFELALGVQWACEIPCWGRFFVQGTYEGSLWTAAGAPTLTFLGFEGFGVSVGLDR